MHQVCRYVFLLMVLTSHRSVFLLQPHTFLQHVNMLRCMFAPTCQASWADTYEVGGESFCGNCTLHQLSFKPTVALTETRQPTQCMTENREKEGERKRGETENEGGIEEHRSELTH